jgi:predicted thioesterase
MVSVSGLGPIEDLRRPAEVTLAPGISRSLEFACEGVLLTDVGGTIAVQVLSTPGMIGVMERNCAILALEHLPEGLATVGFEVCVKHVAGAPAGAACVARARLREIADARKLRFDVEVLEGERTIGVGTHERRVVEVASFR